MPPLPITVSPFKTRAEEFGEGFAGFAKNLVEGQRFQQQQALQGRQVDVAERQVGVAEQGNVIAQDRNDISRQRNTLDSASQDTPEERAAKLRKLMAERDLLIAKTAELEPGLQKRALELGLVTQILQSSSSKDRAAMLKVFGPIIKEHLPTVDVDGYNAVVTTDNLDVQMLMDQFKTEILEPMYQLQTPALSPTEWMKRVDETLEDGQFKSTLLSMGKEAIVDDSPEGRAATAAAIAKAKEDKATAGVTLDAIDELRTGGASPVAINQAIQGPQPQPDLQGRKVDQTLDSVLANARARLKALNNPSSSRRREGDTPDTPGIQDAKMFDKVIPLLKVGSTHQADVLIQEYVDAAEKITVFNLEEGSQELADIRDKEKKRRAKEALRILLLDQAREL